MADAATTHLIQQTVLKYVAANTMFTAYDVTMEVRAQGAFVKHGEARDIVHQLFLDGVLGPQYQRSVVDIGTSTKPFVYHRFSEDARNYKSPGTGATSAAPANNPPAATPGIFQRVVSAVFGSGSAPAPPATGGSPAQSWTQTTRSAPPKQRKPIKLDLDASDYLPIARTVLLAKAKQTNVWGSPWFGRRDLIPPLDDDRTKLICRLRFHSCGGWRFITTLLRGRTMSVLRFRKIGRCSHAECPSSENRGRAVVDSDGNPEQTTNGTMCSRFYSRTKHSDQCVAACRSGRGCEHGSGELLSDYHVSSRAKDVSSAGIFAVRRDCLCVAVYRMSKTHGNLRGRIVLRCDRSARIASGGLHQSGNLQPDCEKTRSTSAGPGRQTGHHVYSLRRRHHVFRRRSSANANCLCDGLCAAHR